MNSHTKRAADNLSHIDQIMRRVQDCDWNRFKLHEIVTLERCLQECSVSDPQFNVILRKLANESVFVEPSKRLEHLNRSKQEEHDDAEHKRLSLELRDQADKLKDDIWFYQLKLDELVEDEKVMRSQILELEKSINSLDSVCKLLTDEFGLLLRRVHNSFDISLSIIKEDLPEYKRAISKSKLVQQIGALPLFHKRCMLKLIKQQRKQNNASNSSLAGDNSMTTVYNFKKLANSHYNDYLVALVNLYRDLALIDKLYSGDISNELDQIRALEQHIGYLECPITGPIRKVTTRRSHSGDIIDGCADDTSNGHNNFGANSVSLDAPLSIVGQALAKLRAAGQQSDMTDDPELARMFSSIARLCKPLNSSLSSSSSNHHSNTTEQESGLSNGNIKG